MTAPGNNRLAVLAAEIKEADGRCRRSAEAAAAAAIEAGHRLIEAKALLRHGEWLPWLREHVAVSDRTAQNYMRLAGSGLEIRTVADLGIRAAVAFAALRPPDDGESLWWKTSTGHSERSVTCWPSQMPGFYHLYYFHYEQDADAYLEATQRPVSWPGVAMHLATWQLAGAPERTAAGTPMLNVLEEHRADILKQWPEREAQ